jgi:hypothetical protein
VAGAAAGRRRLQSRNATCCIARARCSVFKRPALRPAARGASARRSGAIPSSVFHATRLPFDPGSPPIWVDVVLRGGALEPEPPVAYRNSQAKSTR